MSVWQVILLSRKAEHEKHGDRFIKYTSVVCGAIFHSTTKAYLGKILTHWAICKAALQSVFQMTADFFKGEVCNFSTTSIPKLNISRHFHICDVPEAL